MSVIVNKTISGSFEAAALQGEVNASANIVPSCLSISSNGTSVDFEFAAATFSYLLFLVYLFQKPNQMLNHLFFYNLVLLSYN